VMELLEGSTLRNRISGGSLDVLSFYMRSVLLQD
jgi:hypothetical protein